jgi:hypothetical protein
MGSNPKYELRQLPNRSDGTPQYQVLPAGGWHRNFKSS